jgi:Phosphotransferase enzyme family
VGLGPFGPNSQDDFHQFLGRNDTPMQMFEKMIGIDNNISSHGQSYSTKFTHADFAWRNIMVKHHDGTITAIIDWESAGWFPE